MQLQCGPVHSCAPEFITVRVGNVTAVLNGGERLELDANRAERRGGNRLVTRLTPRGAELPFWMSSLLY